MEEAYTMMRDDAVTRVDLRIRCESLVELHAGLVQMWLYCLARELGSGPNEPMITIDVREVTQDNVATLTTMFRKAGVAFFINSDPPPCPLSIFRSSVGQYSLAFSLLPVPNTRCSGFPGLNGPGVS
jgi:hypothetical protein